MPYFHATAVFESRGTSLEEAERAAAALFASLRHPRVHYYEHDTGGGLGPYPPAKSVYFTTIADFDVDAYTEEKAVDIVEEVLDTLSDEEVQYLGHGVVPGSQRVQPAQRTQPEDERKTEQKTRAEQGGQDEHGGKGRRSRGRRRRRGGEREVEGGPEERPQESGPSVPAEEPAPVFTESSAPAIEAPRVEVPIKTKIITRSISEEPAPSTAAPQPEELSPLPPPPRSSALMRVTLRVHIRATELVRPTNESLLPDREDLISLAIAEARRRHPELPASVTPESTISPLPAADQLLTLTWHYDTPVPSVAEAT